MKKTLSYYGFVALTSLLASCAAVYKPVHPETLNFVKSNSDSSKLTAEYHYNVLAEANNNKYHKKEFKNNIQLVALKITNNTDQDFEYNKNFQLYS